MPRTPDNFIGAGSDMRFRKKGALLVPEYPSILKNAVSSKPEFDFKSFNDKGIERVGELNPYITLGCDLRCGYCYMFDFLVKPADTSQLMSPDFLLPMVDFFSKQGNGMDRMTLLGGEPTLHPEITEIVKAVAEMPIAERRMTTNGISTNNLKLEDLPPNAFDHVSISIDGIESSVNNCTRGRGTFARIMTTMERYREANIKLSINYTVTNNNLSTMKDVASFFAERGVSIINFHRASLDGNTYNHTNLLVGAADWVAARDSLLDELRINKGNYKGLTVRIPYTFLTPAEIEKLGYRPIQEQNYHSPKGGHRLIIFPPTEIGQGLCYMSSDVIGQPHAQLGYVTPKGAFVWNEHESNEMIAYTNSHDANVSTSIKKQHDVEADDKYIRVSHSYKAVVTC